MRILHICMVQYSDGWTYQENLLAKYHKRLGNDVVVLTSMLCYQEGKLVEDTKLQFTDINGVSVIRLKKSKSGFMGKFPEYIGFYETLEKLSPDIIFSHGCQYKDAVFTAKYVKDNPNVRLFVDNHADFTNSATNFLSKNFLHKIIWRYYAHRLLPYTEKFWGVLPARVDFLVNVYKLPKEKCQLLVMGADDELVKKSNSEIRNKSIKDEYGIKDSDFLIVTGGKIDEAKLQTELLMKAVSRINKQEVKLIVFGSIEKEIKERILSLVDNKRIFYAGWVTPNQSYDYFAIADLVVFPGRHSVFWEQAAGQGKPLLCRRWPGTQHVDVGGNALFIEEDSVEEIHNKLIEIVGNNELYSSMAKIAAERASRIFSYEEISKRSIM